MQRLEKTAVIMHAMLPPMDHVLMNQYGQECTCLYGETFHHLHTPRRLEIMIPCSAEGLALLMMYCWVGLLLRCHCRLRNLPCVMGYHVEGRELWEPPALHIDHRDAW